MIKPDWADVNVVYGRMQAHGLLRVRVSPGSTMGHIFSIAVFARAARRRQPDFSLTKFIDVYCGWKKIDRNALFAAYSLIRRREGALQPDPIATLEVLSR